MYSNYLSAYGQLGYPHNAKKSTSSRIINEDGNYEDNKVTNKFIMLKITVNIVRALTIKTTSHSHTDYDATHKRVKLLVYIHLIYK